MSTVLDDARFRLTGELTRRGTFVESKEQFEELLSLFSVAETHEQADKIVDDYLLKIADSKVAKAA